MAERAASDRVRDQLCPRLQDRMGEEAIFIAPVIHDLLVKPAADAELVERVIRDQDAMSQHLTAAKCHR